MLRLAASRSRELGRASLLLGNSARALSTSSLASACSSAKAEENSVAGIIKAVNASSSASFASGGLAAIKQQLQPFYPAAAKSEGLSLQAQLAILAVSAIALNNLDRQARGHEWIVDLCLDVLQASWWISFASLIPFRSVYVALRSASPHTAGPLTTLRSAVNIKS